MMAGMYTSRWFEEKDPAAIHDLVRQWPLGAWVISAGGEMVVNHLPFLLSDTEGGRGMLTGHVARANPVWKSLQSGQSSLVIFQGEQAYISPSWYPSKQQDGRSVPTWNYRVVHARGVPHIVEEPAWLIQHLTELTAAHEAGRANPWRLTDAPAGHIEKLVTGIVGIKIPLDSLTGKWKLGQNRTATDRAGVVAGLVSTGDYRALGLAERMAAVGGEVVDEPG